MKIDYLPKLGRRFVMIIYVDDEPWKEVHAKIFGKEILFSACNSIESLQEQFVNLEYVQAKKYALSCLALRSYPSTQLIKLLKRNLVSEVTIQKVIQLFIQLGYLNDEEWIESFIKTQFRRHLGSQMIVYKLMNKGLSQKDAENWVEKYANREDAQKSIHHLLKTKYRHRNLTDYREKQKVFAALMRKGFDVDTIKTVVG